MPRKRCAMLRALVALKVVVIGTLCVVVARRRYDERATAT